MDSSVSELQSDSADRAVALPGDPSVTASRPSSSLSQAATADLSIVQSLSHNFPSSSSRPEITYSLDLAAELPDLFQLLFLQLGEDLDTFTCFGQLPQELKLMIWRFSFPRGRHVNFNSIIGWDLCRHDCSRAVGIERYCPLLATFHVNRESRHETLKNYCIVARPETTIGSLNGLRWRPLYYNPTLDTAFIGMRNGQNLRGWIENVLKTGPGFFSMIKTIEVRSWWILHHTMLGATHSSDRVFERMKPLYKFTGLNHVRVVLNHPKSIYSRQISNASPENAKQRTAAVVTDCLKRSGTWVVTPTVSVEPWSSIR